MSPDRVAVPTLGVLVQDPIEEEELDEEVEANSNTDGLHVNRLPKRSRSSLEQVAEVKRLGSLHTFGSSSTVSSTADLAFDEQPLFNGGAGERNPSPNRRRPSSFKSPRTAASTHSNSYNLRPMTFLSEYSSEKKRRSVSLSEKIAGNIIQQNASGAYMGLLLRCCAIYIAYNVITGISVSAWLTIAAVLAVLVALHITFHLTFLLWTYAVDSMRLTALFAKLRNGVNQVQLWRVSFIAPIRRFFVQQSHAFTRRLKDYIYLNLNMLVTTMLITGFVTASVGLSGFVVFKVVIQGACNQVVFRSYVLVLSRLGRRQMVSRMPHSTRSTRPFHVAPRC